MKRITLTKFMSRERGLFYFCVWNKSNFEDNRFSNTYENIVFLNKGKDKTVVYFDLDEVKKDLEEILRRLKKKGFIDEIIKDYMKHWEILFQYVQKKKKLNNIKDLRLFYETWLNWWHSMATLFLLADIETVPLEIREKSLEIRKKHEKYSEEGNNLFLDFFKAKFPDYANLVEVVTPEEVFSLENRKFSDKKLLSIKERLKGWALINGKVYPINELDNELKENNLVLVEPEANKSEEIKGNVAYKGLIKGYARLISSKSDLDLLRKGEILVSEMTHPGYVPFLNKVSAIVTDEGGIVCHAAIVSREMKIPCIVGTKIATKLLRTGDLIEVDANKGTIKILKRMGDK
ncbi:MAG: PEP-utilizing enzyme [Nanoarchaeota archaeon]